MPVSRRRSRFGLLAAVVLVIAMASCAPAGYSAEGFVGTFEDGEVDSITLLSDGTGTLTALETDYPERQGTWDLTSSGSAFIMFWYDDPVGRMGNNQIWVDSTDRLYLLPDGPDSPNRHYFERAE